RLTTDASITALAEENPFYLEDTVTMLLGPDETVQGGVADVGRRFFEETAAYWRDWVRSLGIPFEWQDAVIRSAITLQLNVFEDTGAIVAAMTTSIPEAPGSGRNWDYRHCWLRDAYFVVNALNRLGATRPTERYLGYIVNVVAGPAERAAYWADQAARIHRVIDQRCWSAARGSFVATMDGDTLDASLLRLNELGFLADDDPRFAGTVVAIERELRRGDFIFRYVEQD